MLHATPRGGDGRITAGHLAVLAGRAAAGPLELILSGRVTGADWSWSQRDGAMARRILATSPPSARTLVVAGNAHTPVRPIELGVPMGARVAGQRPGTREVQISYGGGSFCNCGPRQFARRTEPQGKITAPPAPRRARSGPSHSHGGGRATAPAPMTHRPDPGHLITR